MIKKKMLLSAMKKPEKNIRKHGKAQIDEYMRSVKMFGQIRPILVDENGVILAGNGLYDAMTGIGLTEADVYVMEGLTEAQKKKLMMADNRIFNLGSDDMAVFEEFIAELGGDFDVPGYDADLLQTLAFTEDDVTPAQSSYGTISAEDKEALQRTEQAYERREAAAVETAVEIPAQELPSGHPDAPDLERRFIICPKCGERIWL